MCLSGDDIEIMKISASLVVVLCCVAIAAAQERTIDKTEFDALVASGNNHNLRWKDEKYRMTVSTSSKASGRPQNDWASKFFVERVPTKESRTVTSSTFGGKASPTQESIVVGKWIYTRLGTDPWSRKESKPSGGRAETTESIQEMIGSTAEYRYLGKENLAGRATDIYQKTEHQTKVNKKNGESVESEVKSTYWFGEDGAVLKNEYRSENRSATLTSQTLIIMEWEIDPSIVITEPVLAPVKP